MTAGRRSTRIVDHGTGQRTRRTEDHGNLLWDFVQREVERGTPHTSLEELIVRASGKGLSPTLDDVYSFAEREPRHARELYPRLISRFLAAYAAEIDATTLLDPHAGLSSPILTVAERIEPSQAIALCPHENSLEAAEALDSLGRVTWLLGDATTNAEIRKAGFDLILCAAPVGMPPVTRQFDDAERPVRDSEGHLQIIQAGGALSDQGVGVFVVSPKFLLDRSQNCVRKRLSDFGLSLTAFVTVPQQRWGFPARLGLAFVRRGEADVVFAGILTDNNKRNQVLLKNLVAHRDGGSATIGRLVPSTDFVSLQGSRSGTAATGHLGPAEPRPPDRSFGGRLPQADPTRRLRLGSP